jgi:hypothetical protein
MVSHYNPDLLFFECSAYSGDNIENIFHALAKNIMKKLSEGLIEMNNNPFPVIQLEKKEEEKSQNCNC